MKINRDLKAALLKLVREMRQRDCGTNRNDFDELHGTFPVLEWAARIKALVGGTK